jgi:hypothetical protein
MKPRRNGAYVYNDAERKTFAGGCDGCFVSLSRSERKRDRPLTAPHKGIALFSRRKLVLSNGW